MSIIYSYTIFITILLLRRHSQSHARSLWLTMSYISIIPNRCSIRFRSKISLYSSFYNIGTNENGGEKSQKRGCIILFVSKRHINDMIGEYERDEIFLSRIGNHPKTWSPTEAQVRAGKMADCWLPLTNGLMDRLIDELFDWKDD